MSTKVTCVKTLEFDTAHRVMNHESKCANLHGHGYELHVTARAQNLDELGRIIDFSVLKQKIGDWVDEKWDHTTLLFEKDKEAIELVEKVQANKKVFVCSFNPTAENMANYILTDVAPKLLIGTGVEVVKVRLYETPNCYADAEL